MKTRGARCVNHSLIYKVLPTTEFYTLPWYQHRKSMRTSSKSSRNCCDSVSVKSPNSVKSDLKHFSVLLLSYWWQWNPSSSFTSFHQLMNSLVNKPSIWWAGRRLMLCPIITTVICASWSYSPLMWSLSLSLARPLSVVLWDVQGRRCLPQLLN